MRILRTVFAMAALLWLAASPARAEVVRVDVTTRQDVLGGRAFGAAGAYEWIQGKAYFTLDPKRPRNEIIVDLALAPRNAAGLVEFSADILIVRPKDPARASGVAVFDVVNRGRPQIFSFLNHGSLPARADAEAFFGDGFLMKQGATIVWLGWQQDAAASPNLLRMTGPRIPGVTGVVNGEFVVPKRVDEVPLGDRGAIPYEVADINAAENTLRVASARGEASKAVPRSQWRFGATNLHLDGGFEPGAVYEYTYLSKEPLVSGLGLAGVREIIAWMRFDPAALAHATRAYAFGISQSGRFLRQFVHDGFNADVKSGRPVFDGMMIHIAGGSSRGFNGRFSQASLSPPSRVFPFTDLEQTDAVTGQRGGLLSRSSSANVVPKILYTSSAWEYWGAAASNIHTTIDGKADMRLPETSRIYLMAGTQHVPVAAPLYDDAEPGQLRENPLNYRPVLRALFVALDKWVHDGVAPPPSEFPTVAAGTLVPTSQLDMRAFKAIKTPPGPKLFYRPAGGKAYVSLVSKVDVDGNEIAGVRVPEQLVPLATYTGWNLRSPQIGAPTDLIQSTGSYYPLAATRADRERTGDPRLSIAERYPSMNDYLGKVEAAARALVGRRLLLADDVAFVTAAAQTHWQAATAGSQATATGVTNAPVAVQSAAEGKMLRPNATLHIVADLNRSVAFYRDLVGLELDSEAFLPSGRSPEVARLTNTPGAEVRTATFRIPGTEVRLVLAQFTAGAGAPVQTRLQDFGQIKTVLRVRDIDAQFAKVQKGISGVFTTGGGPVRPEGPNGINRAVITRDPDGAPLEFVYQTVPPIPDSVPATSNVVGGWASFVVQDLAKTIEFYKTGFGFDVRGTGRQASAALLSLQGLPDATTTMSTGGRPPGAAYTWFMYAYDGVEKKAINGRLSQPGMTALSFYVDNVRAMVASLKAAGARVETDGGEPVNIGGIDRVFVRDPSGVLIELSSAR